jgi:hypothetical protein
VRVNGGQAARRGRDGGVARMDAETAMPEAYKRRAANKAAGLRADAVAASSSPLRCGDVGGYVGPTDEKWGTRSQRENSSIFDPRTVCRHRFSIENGFLLFSFH